MGIDNIGELTETLHRAYPSDDKNKANIFVKNMVNIVREYSTVALDDSIRWEGSLISDYGFDSITNMEVLLGVESEYGVEFPDTLGMEYGNKSFGDFVCEIYENLRLEAKF
jgi:acyl carrier protein